MSFLSEQDTETSGEHYPEQAETHEPEPQSPYQFYIRISPPYVTRFLLAANVVVFVAMIVFGYLVLDTLNGTTDFRVLTVFGAKINQLIVQGQYWRLFTAMFLHIGVWHLLFNLYALNALGPLVEGYFGHVRFALI